MYVLILTEFLKKGQTVLNLQNIVEFVFFLILTENFKNLNEKVSFKSM